MISHHRNISLKEMKKTMTGHTYTCSEKKGVSYWPLEYSNIFNIKSELKTLDGALGNPSSEISYEIH